MEKTRPFGGASIEAPNTEEKEDGVHHARPGEPKGEEAKAALLKLISGRKVRALVRASSRLAGIEVGLPRSSK